MRKTLGKWYSSHYNGPPLIVGELKQMLADVPNEVIIECRSIITLKDFDICFIEYDVDNNILKLIEDQPAE